MARKAFDAIAGGLRDAIAHARGEDSRGRIRRVHVPDVDVAKMRAKLGLSQEDFAAAFGVSLGTVRNWEQGRRRPEGPGRNQRNQHYQQLRLRFGPRRRHWYSRSFRKYAQTFFDLDQALPLVKSTNRWIF